MKSSFGNSRRMFLSNARSANGSPAFTLIELVVVIGGIALLAATLLPALASTKFCDQLAYCTSNYHRWGVTWTTAAGDNADGSFPMGIVIGSGKDVWDVPLTMISNLAPYGLTVPMWYCPVRSWEFAADNAACIQHLGHPEKTLAHLYQAVPYQNRFASPNPQTTFAIIYHNVWIQRYASENPQSIFPTVHNPVFPQNPNVNANSAAGLPLPYDWLEKPSDPKAAQIPIMSDRVIGNTAQMFPGTGHPVGGSQSGAVYNENLLYGDGHVETHQTNTMVWRWKGIYVAWY